MRMILALLAGAALYGQVPAQDSRNTEIPNTDTHFTARSYQTLAEWQARREHLRKQVLSAAGLMPMLPKNDLHAQIFGKIENRTYSIEKVLIETLPGYYLGGNLYRPMKAAPEGGFPAIVSPHGHWNYGRLEHSVTASVPARCINLAQQGYVVFAYDMVGYNDTIQTPHDFGSPREQLWDFGPFSLQLWNSIRAVDFVQSLPGVNPARIGATGASGGATQTFTLAAVDDRIQFSAPVNMVSAIMQGGGLCENAPNLRLDTFNVEIASIMAPKPMMLVSATGDWTKNTATEEFPAIRAIYELYDKAANVETLHLDAPHNYNQQNREAVYRFFGKQVLGERDASKFKEKNIRLEKLQDMLALLNRKLPDNALDYDGVVAEWIRMGEAQARRVTDRAQAREMLEFALGAEWPERVVQESEGEKVLFGRPGRGDRVAGMVRQGTGRKVLLVHPDGAEAARKSTEFAALAKTGRPVYTVDAFQTGAAVAPRNRDAKMFLTFNRSDDANRVQDILTVLRGLDSDVELVGVGKAAVWCQFAAALARRPVELKADLGGFTGSDQEYLDSFFVPGIQRAGGLRAARMLTGK
uniref:Acetyl xylan esterase domain-containing protein n=1 Tax=Solibacter usitatus (strain Ellin6076) TaxID=234267 RepID=Q01SB1_SOLUE